MNVKRSFVHGNLEVEIYMYPCVDNMLIARKKTNDIVDLKRRLSDKFEIKDLGMQFFEIVAKNCFNSLKQSIFVNSYSISIYKEGRNYVPYCLHM